MFKSLSIITLISLFCFSGCKDNTPKKTNLTQEVAFTKQGTLKIINPETAKEKTSFDIEIADNEYKTQSMEANQAMLFIFKNEQPRSFYMKNTLFSLDIIYADAKKKIVSIQKSAKPLDPTSLPSNAPTTYVIEINGGLSDTLGIAVGDIFKFTKE
jgi:uncharacterized membrane protein (UPF0127 family)